MKVFITGATGFVGRMVVARLLGEGHQIVAWCRNASSARGALGADVSVQSPKTSTLEEALVGCDAIINLQGENVFGGRWTKARKRRIEESRVDFTQALAKALHGLKGPVPQVLISASAVGYYRHEVSREVAEHAPPGDDFLARLCVRWESAAEAMRDLGVRVVTLRIGVVLGRGGGALEKMLPAFRLGLGGELGSGKQAVSWIHMNDLVSIVSAALSDARYQGPVNATAPHSVTNAELTRALAKTLGRSAGFRAPALLLRAGLGEAASVLLEGQRVRPAFLEAVGFPFEFEQIEPALEDLVNGGGVEFKDVKGRNARHVLEQETLIDAPVQHVFEFFAKAENLGAMTPPDLSFSIRNPASVAMGEGTRLDYDIKLGQLPLRWTSVIERWAPGSGFADKQLEGPYAYWYHEHHFEPEGERTLMRDIVRYRLPFGPLGRLIHRLVVRSQLRDIFSYRHQYTAQRFAQARAACSRPNAA